MLECFYPSPMKHFRNHTLILGVLLCLSVVAHAQEEEPVEAPPPPSPELTEEEQVWQKRFERSDGFRTKMMQTRRGVDLYYEFRNKNQEDIEDNRAECQENIHRSNRDTKFSTILVCYRKELLLNLELLEKQRQFAESVPGVSDDIRAHALQEIDTLTTAINSVIEGLESNVFLNIEDLTEAKKNLHLVYRTPTLLAILHVETDRAITWVAHIMHRLLTTTQNNELNPDSFAKAFEALTCFKNSELELADVAVISEYEDANDKMSQALKNLQVCADVLREAHTLQETFENPPVEEEPEINEEYSPRRRWKNQ